MICLMKIIKTNLYLSALKKLKITDAEEGVLISELAENPKKGDVIPNSGGFRKIRMAFGGRGKSKGARVIYFYVVQVLDNADIIYLVMAYSKNQKVNLTSSELKQLRELAKELK